MSAIICFGNRSIILHALEDSTTLVVSCNCISMVHSSLTPSPVHRASPHSQWNAPITVFFSLLQQAEQNPLEYTIAEWNDAFANARLLLKVLDQDTVPANPGMVSQLKLHQQEMEEEEVATECSTTQWTSRTS
jgi:hypothetical protein